MKRMSLILQVVTLISTLYIGMSQAYAADLTGTISGLDEQPLSKAKVTLTQGRQHFLQTTGVKGAYHFANLAPGKYTISVESKDTIMFNSSVDVTPAKVKQFDVVLMPVRLSVYQYMPHSELTYI